MYLYTDIICNLAKTFGKSSLLTSTFFYDKLFRITQTNYDGSCKNTVAKDTNVGEPYGLVVFAEEKYLIWSDIKKRSDGYYIMKSEFHGETNLLYKSEKIINELDIVFNRSSGMFNFFLVSQLTPFYKKI